MYLALTQLFLPARCPGLWMYQGKGGRAVVLEELNCALELHHRPGVP